MIVTCFNNLYPSDSRICVLQPNLDIAVHGIKRAHSVAVLDLEAYTFVLNVQENEYSWYTD